MIPERVADRYLDSLIAAEGRCMVSTYSVGSHGYSQIGYGENGKTKMLLGHRVAWELANGAVPKGLTIDHLCRNRRCGNVDHLRLLPNIENARLNGNAVKTECKRGHRFDDENTYINRLGHRICRACAKILKHR